MITTHSPAEFKADQEKFIRKNRAYLAKKGRLIQSVKPKTTFSTAKESKMIQDKPGKNSSQKLDSLADKVSQPLLKMTTLPLLELFPTTVTLDLKKITIDTMLFIKSHSIQTITYENLKEVSLESGLIASALRLVLTGQSMRPIVLPNFKKREAAEAKRIILGLMQCHKNQIKPDDLDPQRDLDKIITLGTAASPE
jgi:hypothetical protein